MAQQVVAGIQLIRTISYIAKELPRQCTPSEMFTFSYDYRFPSCILIRLIRPIDSRQTQLRAKWKKKPSNALEMRELLKWPAFAHLNLCDKRPHGSCIGRSYASMSSFRKTWAYVSQKLYALDYEKLNVWCYEQK